MCQCNLVYHLHSTGAPLTALCGVCAYPTSHALQATEFSIAFYRHLLCFPAMSPFAAWKKAVLHLMQEKYPARLWGQFVFVGHPGFA